MADVRSTPIRMILYAASLLVLTHAQSIMSPGGRGRMPVMSTGPRIPGRVTNPMLNRRPDTRGPGFPRPMGVTSSAGGQPVTCAQAGRNAVAQCFLNNGGFQMQFVVSLLSNGTQGPLPPNSGQMRDRICKSEGLILSCVFASVNTLQNSQWCPTTSEYTRLEQEAVALISGMQQMCGKGPLPAPSLCLTDLNKNLGQCYNRVGLNPELFNPTGQAMDPGRAGKIIGAVIGENAQVAGKFCRVKRRLFTCMKEVMDKCPGSMELTALSGYDHESMQKGIDVLCHDVNNYVEGLKCFQTPPAEVSRCYSTLVSGVANLTAEQIDRSMSMPEFYTRFCQMKIRSMECDLQAWRRTCEKKAVGLKNEYECNLLPTTCKNDRSLQNQLQETCAVERFERQLRSGVSRVISASGLMMTVLTVVFMFIL